MATRFPTKRDAWIVALIWAGAAGVAFGGFAQLSAQGPAWVRSLMLLLFIGAAGFMLWILYATDYVIGKKELFIRSGPLRYRVPLAEIESVTPSRSPLSSPAASLDRLVIRWSPHNRQLLISPEPRHKFLKELSHRCPQLTHEGDRLTAKDAG